MRTWSPCLKAITPTPTSSTMPHPSCPKIVPGWKQKEKMKAKKTTMKLLINPWSSLVLTLHVATSPFSKEQKQTTTNNTEYESLHNLSLWFSLLRTFKIWRSVPQIVLCVIWKKQVKKHEESTGTTWGIIEDCAKKHTYFHDGISWVLDLRRRAIRNEALLTRTIVNECLHLTTAKFNEAKSRRREGDADRSKGKNHSRHENQAQQAWRNLTEAEEKRNHFELQAMQKKPGWKRAQTTEIEPRASGTSCHVVFERNRRETTREGRERRNRNGWASTQSSEFSSNCLESEECNTKSQHRALKNNWTTKSESTSFPNWKSRPLDLLLHLFDFWNVLSFPKRDFMKQSEWSRNKGDHSAMSLKVFQQFSQLSLLVRVAISWQQ